MAHPSWPGRLALGFLAGAASVLVFHQGLLALLHALGATDRAPFPTQPTWPLGVPEVWSLVFWGGVWGAALVTTDRRLPRGASSIAAGALFGAVAPTVVAWFVVAPLKGQPVAGGGRLPVMATALLLNAAWGAGTALLLLIVGHWRARRAPAACGPAAEPSGLPARSSR